MPALPGSLPYIRAAGFSNLRMTWLSNGLVWPQYTGTPGQDDQTKVGERFFYPQLSFGLGARNFHTILSCWVKFRPCHIPGALIKLWTTNIINKRIALENAL